MIDLTPWHNMDTDRQAKRKENWVLIEKYLKYRLEGRSDTNESEYLKIAQDYYFGDDIELLPIKERRAQGKEFLYWKVRLVLHPDPTVASIKAVLDDWQEKGYGNSAPFASSYQFPLEAWKYYLENDFTPVSLCSNYMEVVFGETFEDTLRINQLTVEEHGAEMFEWLSRSMLRCTGNSDEISGTSDRWVRLYLSCLEHITNDQFDKAAYYGKGVYKRIKLYESKPKNETKLLAMDVVAHLRKTLISNRDQYCSEMQKCIDDMQQYFVDNNIALD